MNGKGDKRRPVSEDNYRDNYDRIFKGKKVRKKKPKHNPVLKSLQDDLKLCQDLIDKTRLSEDPSKDADLDKYYRIQNAILEEIERNGG